MLHQNPNIATGLVGMNVSRSEVCSKRLAEKPGVKNTNALCNYTGDPETVRLQPTHIITTPAGRGALLRGHGDLKRTRVHDHTRPLASVPMES